MSRWAPDAPGRLAVAAIELFEERGYEGTTVDDIASRAGVTKRTFFRHYGDKREVMFGLGDGFERMLVDALDAVPPDVAPLEAVLEALEGIADWFEERRPWSVRRQRILNANPELHERELIKLAGIGRAFATRLQARGADPVTADLAAETGMALFRHAFAQWAAAADGADLRELLRTALAQLQAVAMSPVTAATAASTSSSAGNSSPRPSTSP